jgi:hypothetical protein
VDSIKTQGFASEEHLSSFSGSSQVISSFAQTDRFRQRGSSSSSSQVATSHKVNQPY